MATLKALEALAAHLVSESITPKWDNEGVPRCSDDACPQYDGKRCRWFGGRPGPICEPAVVYMAVALTAPAERGGISGGRDGT